MEKIADYLVYIRDGEIILNDSIESLMSKFQIIKGNHNDLDEELEELLIYRETRKTGYTALTQHAQTFKEIFGNEIEVQKPSIEELMIYLEKYKNKLSETLTLESEDKK